MVNFKRIIFGASFWFIGLIVMYIINSIIPPTINTLEDTIPLGDGGIMIAIVWLAILIIWILLTLVIPMYNVIEGLKEGESGKFSYIIVGLIFWIFSMAFVYVQYQNLPILANIIATDTITKAVFWGSTIMVWILIVVGIPGYMIIKGYSKGETG